MLILSGLFINDKQAPVDMLIVGNFDTNKVAKLVKIWKKNWLMK